MHVILRHVAACAASTVALIALTGSALAAPPETPPGLETAPGQAKKAEEAATPAPAASAPAATGAGAPASSKGQEKKAAKASASSSQGSHGIRSTNAGVKPSNDTKKHTSCTTGGSVSSPTCTGTNVTAATAERAAGNDHSKRYGNGSTAAQIAVSRGGVGVEVRGPGNSQPHKVCKKVNNGGKAVWADVHAVKSFPAACVAAPSAQAPSVQAPAVARAPGFGPTAVTTAPVVAPAAAARAAAAAAAAAAAPAAGGVAGVTAARPEAGGVAGAFSEIGGVAGGALPFTGFPLWAAIVLAISAIVIGIALRRSGRALTTPV